ncbi:oligosaccharide flippase family protein [bacterium]|nr:oligosaccharide flippase family protein [bacterium]
MVNKTSVNKGSGSLLGNVSFLTGSMALVQVLNFISMPIITRFFSPAAFGVATLFTSSIAILATVQSLRYDAALVLPEKDEEAVQLFGLNVLFIFSTGILFLVLSFFFGKWLTTLLRAPGLTPYTLLIAPGATLISLAFFFKYWNIRNGHFRNTSYSTLALGGTRTFFSVGFGAIGFTTAGYLIVARLFGFFAQNLVYLVRVVRQDLPFIRFNLTRKGMREAFFRYSDFPRFTIWARLVNQLSMHSMPLVVGYYFAESIVGVFSFAVFLLRTPFEMLGDAILQVYYQLFSERVSNAKPINGIVERLLHFLFGVSFGPFLLFLVVVQDIIPLLLGAQWENVGIYTLLNAPWVVMLFLTMPIRSLFYVYDKQRLELLYDVIVFGARVLALVVGAILFQDAIKAVFLFAAVSVIVTGIRVLHLIILADASILRIFRSLAVVLLYTLLPVTLLFCGKYFLELSPVVLTVSLVLLTLFYYLLLWKFDTQFHRHSSEFIDKLRKRAKSGD